jgi:putative SOS response-associated peptidase YedK
LRALRRANSARAMCNLYPMTSNAEAIRQFANHMRDIVGNLPVLPGIFPAYSAPIVRNAPDGARELAMARWACRRRIWR